MLALSLPIQEIQAKDLARFSLEQQLASSTEEEQLIELTIATDTPMNAVSALIALPSDISPSDITLHFENSIIDFWIAEPTLNEDSNTIYFAGVVFNEGFRGTTSLATISTHSTKLDPSHIEWLSTELLAADGQGTSIDHRSE